MPTARIWRRRPNAAAESVRTALKELIAGNRFRSRGTARDAQASAQGLRTRLGDSGIGEDLAVALDAQLESIEFALQSSITAVIGVWTTLPAVSGSVALGRSRTASSP